MIIINSVPVSSKTRFSFNVCRQRGQEFKEKCRRANVYAKTQYKAANDILMKRMQNLVQLKHQNTHFKKIKQFYFYIVTSKKERAPECLNHYTI